MGRADVRPVSQVVMPTNQKPKLTLPQPGRVSTKPGSTHLFFNGCCVPSASLLWMILVIFMFIVVLSLCGCVAIVMTRIYYRWKGRRRIELEQKHRREDDEIRRLEAFRKKQLEMQFLARAPFNRDETSRAPGVTALATTPLYRERFTTARMPEAGDDDRRHLNQMGDKSPKLLVKNDEGKKEVAVEVPDTEKNASLKKYKEELEKLEEKTAALPSLRTATEKTQPRQGKPQNDSLKANIEDMQVDSQIKPTHRKHSKHSEHSKRSKHSKQGKKRHRKSHKSKDQRSKHERSKRSKKEEKGKSPKKEHEPIKKCAEQKTPDKPAHSGSDGNQRKRHKKHRKKHGRKRSEGESTLGKDREVRSTSTSTITPTKSKQKASDEAQKSKDRKKRRSSSISVTPTTSTTESVTSECPSIASSQTSQAPSSFSSVSKRPSTVSVEMSSGGNNSKPCQSSSGDETSTIRSESSVAPSSASSGRRSSTKNGREEYKIDAVKTAGFVEHMAMNKKKIKRMKANKDFILVPADTNEMSVTGPRIRTPATVTPSESETDDEYEHQQASVPRERVDESPAMSRPGRVVRYSVPEAESHRTLRTNPTQDSPNDKKIEPSAVERSEMNSSSSRTPHKNAVTSAVLNMLPRSSFLGDSLYWTSASSKHMNIEPHTSPDSGELRQVVVHSQERTFYLPPDKRAEAKLKREAELRNERYHPPKDLPSILPSSPNAPSWRCSSARDEHQRDTRRIKRSSSPLAQHHHSTSRAHPYGTMESPYSPDAPSTSHRHASDSKNHAYGLLKRSSPSLKPLPEESPLSRVGSYVPSSSLPSVQYATKLQLH